MTRLVARAPGKLFLLGEYAVLDGGPAVVAGIDRYVEVHVAPARTRVVRIAAPGYTDAVEFAPGGPLPDCAGLRFALAAYAEATTAWPRTADAGLELSITSQLDCRSGAKTGLGSSAAVAVATVGAIFALAGFEGTPRRFQDAVFTTALRAHRHAQGGTGSGADVAASTYGGIVRFHPRRQAPPHTTALSLPPDVLLLAAWTGTAAPTVELVRAYAALPENGRRAAFRRASQKSVDWFVAALQRGALSVAAIEAGREALAELADLGLPLLTPALRELIAIARACGVAAKPSGAGGGDCGVALTADPAAAQRVRAAWQAAGLVPVELGVSREGVTVAAH
jgi:phosphomevalonate kinase